MDQIKDESATQIKEMRIHTQLLWVTLEKRSRLAEARVNRSMILKSTSRKQYVRLWNGLDSFKTESSNGFLLR
jgi:hypothetical protein